MQPWLWNVLVMKALSFPDFSWSIGYFKIRNVQEYTVIGIWKLFRIFS